MPASRSYRVVWALLVFAWVGNYLVRVALSALLPPIMHELDLSYARAGFLASGFFYAYAAMQFPAGILGDRFGRRRILALGLVTGAVASLATGLSRSFVALLGARLLTGIGQGCLFSNDRAIIASVTPPEKISLGQAVSFTGPGLGIGLGLLLGGVLGAHLPWRAVFLLFAIPPVVAALLVVRFVPTARPGVASRSGAGELRRVIRERDVWILGITGAGVMWLQFALATWGPALFLEVGVRDLGTAGLASSLLGVGAVTGLLAGGGLGDRARRRGRQGLHVLLACFLGMTAASACTALAIQVHPSPWPVAVGLFVANAAAWAVWGPFFALLGDRFRGRDVSSAFGLYNSIMVVGAILGPLVTGWAHDVTGSFAAGLYITGAVTLAAAAGLRPLRAS